MSKLKVLNLYAGIGGNRKLWTDVEVTAVELNPKIAGIYQDFFPEDKVIVADAHVFLCNFFKDYDFIWSSPPCPSHSQFRKSFSCNNGAEPIYPDMQLYQEILFLKHYFSGKWVVENVIAYYEPLIRPSEIQRHWFWHNFIVPNRAFQSDTINLTGGRNEDAEVQIKRLESRHGFDLSKYSVDKRTALRNCVTPELGLYLLSCARKEESDLFKLTPPK